MGPLRVSGRNNRSFRLATRCPAYGVRARASVERAGRTSRPAGASGWMTVCLRRRPAGTGTVPGTGTGTGTAAALIFSSSRHDATALQVLVLNREAFERMVADGTIAPETRERARAMSRAHSQNDAARIAAQAQTEHAAPSSRGETLVARVPSDRRLF